MSFLRLSSPFEIPTDAQKLENIARKYDGVVRKFQNVRDKLLNLGYFTQLSTELNEIVSSDLNEKRKQQAFHALIYSALKGNHSARYWLRSYLVKKILSKSATKDEIEYFYSLTVLNSLDVNKRRPDIYDLAKMFLEGTYGIAKDNSEAIFWYSKDEVTQCYLHPVEFVPTPLWLVLCCEKFKDVSGDGSHLHLSYIRDFLNLIVSSENKEFYLKYFDTIFPINSKRDFNEIVKIALLTSELKEHILSVKDFLLAAEMKSNNYEKLNYIKSAWAEAEKVDRPSGLRMMAEMLFDLEQMLKFVSQKAPSDMNEERQRQDLMQTVINFQKIFGDRLGVYKEVLLNMARKEILLQQPAMQTTAKLMLTMPSIIDESFTPYVSAKPKQLKAAETLKATKEIDAAEEMKTSKEAKTEIIITADKEEDGLEQKEIRALDRIAGVLRI